MEYIYRLPEFEKAVNEHFDLSDRETYSYLRSIEEADQNKVLLALTSKLYDHLVDKVDDIDFGDIPKSRGDVTKLPNYEKILDCIRILKEILMNTHQDLEPVLVLEQTIQNLEKNKEIFIKAYQLNVEFPMVIYNTSVLSVYSGLSVLIASCIEFIKSPDGTGFDIALDKVQLKKTKDSLLFRDLNKLNISFDHELPEALNSLVKQNTKNLVGEVKAGLVLTGKIIASILFIIPLLRDLVYYFFYSCNKVSVYFDTQSALLQMNAYNLAAKGSSNEKDIKEIQSKQLKIADRFKKISNALQVKSNKAEIATEKSAKELEKKLKISDVKDDSTSSIW